MSLQPAIKNSKKKRKVMVEDLIGESPAIVKIEVGDTSNEGIIVKGNEKIVPVKQRRRRFISLKEFDKLAQDPPVEWCVVTERLHIQIG